MTDARYDPLVAWAEKEQAELWHDLAWAIGSACNGIWSMECDALVVRIVSAARLVGPTPWDQIVWSILAGGVYHAVLAGAGITADQVSDEEWERLDGLMPEKRAVWQQSSVSTVLKAAGSARDGAA